MCQIFEVFAVDFENSVSYLEALVVGGGIWLDVADEDAGVVASFETDADGFFAFVEDDFSFVGVVEGAGDGEVMRGGFWKMISLIDDRLSSEIQT